MGLIYEQVQGREGKEKWVKSIVGPNFKVLPYWNRFSRG
jgi:hypothetical protein